MYRGCHTVFGQTKTMIPIMSAIRTIIHAPKRVSGFGQSSGASFVKYISLAITLIHKASIPTNATKRMRTLRR